MIDIKGIKFNKLTAINYMGKSKWRFICDCGKTTIKEGYSVKNGRTKSCGCLREEAARKLNLKKWGESSFTHIYLSYKKRSEYMDRIFDLSKEEVKKLIDSPCHYCGAQRSNEKKSRFNNGSYFYNGLDRVNNNNGYEISNVVSSCWKCNEAKKTMLYNDFLAWISRVYKHRIEKKTNYETYSDNNKTSRY